MTPRAAASAGSPRGLSRDYQAWAADALLDQGPAWQRGAHSPVYSEARGCSCQSPRGAWMQKAIEGRPQRHVFSPVAWREDRTAEAQEDGCFPSAGSRQILSEPPKERSRQNTPDKQELWRGQEIKDEGGGRPGTQAPFRSAGSRARPIVGARGLRRRRLASFSP